MTEMGEIFASMDISIQEILIRHLNWEEAQEEGEYEKLCIEIKIKELEARLEKAKFDQIIRRNKLHDL